MYAEIYEIVKGQKTGIAQKSGYIWFYSAQALERAVEMDVSGMDESKRLHVFYISGGFEI